MTIKSEQCNLYGYSNIDVRGEEDKTDHTPEMGTGGVYTVRAPVRHGPVYPVRTVRYSQHKQNTYFCAINCVKNS